MTEHVGGQAVLEGVMMRKGDKVATAVRLSNGRIKVKNDKLKQKGKFWKIPFIRGVVSLEETLVIGMKHLMWSAEQQMEKHEKITKAEVAWTILISLGFAVLLFIIIPFFLTKLIIEKGVFFNIIDGVLRIMIFLAYLLIISSFGDVKRLFQYHGAEHKAVNCHEAGKKITVENVKKYSTLHTRCGTSFIFIVLIISIIAFSFFSTDKWYLNLAARIILIPAIVSISYELLRLGAKYYRNPVMKIAVLPGLLMQKISTKEPNKKQIETAIAALKRVL